MLYIMFIFQFISLIQIIYWDNRYFNTFFDLQYGVNTAVPPSVVLAVDVCPATQSPGLVLTYTVLPDHVTAYENRHTLDIIYLILERQRREACISADGITNCM